MTDPFGIVLGDDGAHWIANFAKDTLTRLAPDRTVTTLPGFSAGSGPRHITVGAGHTLWVGLETAKKIARVSGVEPPPPQPQPQPVPESQPQPPPMVDTTAPSVTKVAVRRRVRRNKAPVVRLSLSETARVTITLHRRHHRHLTRVLRRTVTLAAGNRRETLRLPKHRHLKLGRYRLTLVARDLAGNRAKPVTRAFTVVR